ncbi:MAG TPA: hypothetical protein VN428_03450 [Bryobacteraceae bacterium]|nr:hypothetical protein [Bryobacteraceae bacterium]
MRRRIYLTTRDFHLYSGLFISPFVLIFAISVFFLVHAWVPGLSPEATAPKRTVHGLHLSADVENLSGRPRVDAIRDVLDQAGVQGEIGFIRHMPKERRLVVPVSVPGRETTIEIDVLTRSAVVVERQTGLADALIMLHKSPGPHLANIRMNWLPMLVWRWLADATVYLLLLLSATGIYLWIPLRAERKIGIALLTAGAFSLIGVIYAIAR